MRNSLTARLANFLCRTRAGWERLEAIQFAAPWRKDRLPARCGPGQA